VITPIEVPKLKSFLIDEYLSTYLRDTAQAHELQSDGSYTRVMPVANESEFSAQLAFQEPSNIIDFSSRTSS